MRITIAIVKAERQNMKTLKRHFVTLTLGVLAFSGAASGQNQDLALPLGVIAPHYSITSGPDSTVSAGAGAAFQINYGHQITGTKWGDLYSEFPVIFAARGDSVTGPYTVSDNASGMGAFLPGARFRFPSFGRASFFVAAGGGIGWYDRNVISVGRTSVSINCGVTATPAFDFGGGMDLRLTRLLSLRGEVRDLITSQGSLNGVGHHNPIIAFGPAFHF
jgi:hypothetical protein